MHEQILKALVVDELIEHKGVVLVTQIVRNCSHHRDQCLIEYLIDLLTK